jgi:hypothetical protein
MDIRGAGKSKCPQCNRCSGVQRCSEWRVPKSKEFEPDVKRKRDGADQPRGQPPNKLRRV